METKSKRILKSQAHQLLGGVNVFMPPKKKAQSSMSKEICCAFCQPVVKEKDESLFCGGGCQQWLHRYCAGVSTQVYKGIKEKGATFFCYACCLEKHRREIDGLNAAVDQLKGEIAELNSATSVQRSVPASLPPSSSRSVPAPINEASISPPSSSTVSSQANNRSQERKFNVVLFGVDESHGVTKFARLEEDLKKATSVLSDVNESINSHSIKDIYRLGKFSTGNSKPRPLLVKFIRAADATRILSKRGSSRGSPIVIKPDMSPTERKCESLLLKERWSLMQSGVPRDVIKIRGSRLLVRNYGQVSSCGSDLLFSCQKSRSVVNDSAVEISSPIVPITTPQLSQPQVVTSVALNVNGYSASSQDPSSTLPPSSPPQSSSTTPVSSQ